MIPMYLLFSRYDAQVVVVAERKIVDAVKLLAIPFMQTQEIDGPLTNVWTVSSSHRYAPSGLPFEEKIEEAPGEPTRFSSINFERKWVVLGDESEEWLVQNMLRLIRNLLRLQLFAQGAIFLHGAMVAIAGKGIAYLGKKRSGKTSSLLAALTQEDVELVNNDDLTLLPWFETPLALGWPRAVGIRFDTLDMLEATLPNVRYATRHLTHPVNFIQEPDRFYFYPQELAAVCERSVLPAVPLNMLVFPRFLPSSAESPYMERLSRADAVNAIRQNLEPIPDKYNRFLHAHFSFPDMAYLQHKIDGLASSVPCYILHQSFSALVESAKLPLSLVVSQ